MLLLGVIATLIRFFPLYKWDYTTMNLIEHFDGGFLENLHNLIDTVSPDLNVSFQTSCIEQIDGEVKRFKAKHKKWLLDDVCIETYVRMYKNEVHNHIMRNKHKNEK